MSLRTCGYSGKVASSTVITAVPELGFASVHLLYFEVIGLTKPQIRALIIHLCDPKPN
jgi:hypothetical protein